MSVAKVDNNKELRARRQAALDAAERIVALSEEEGRGLTEAEDQEVKGHLAEAERLEGELAGIERARSARQTLDAAKQTTPVPETQRAADGDPQSPQITVRETHAYEKGDALGAIVSARMRFGPWQQAD